MALTFTIHGIRTNQKNTKYWRGFEEHVKPQANHLLNRFYLRNLKQNGRLLEEFLTEARLLIQNSGYSAELQDELMRDAFMPWYLAPTQTLSEKMHR